MKALGIGGFLALAACGAAQAGIEDLVPEFRKACRPAAGINPALPGDYGTIKAAAVRDGILTIYPLSNDALLQGPDALAQRAMRPRPSEKGAWEDDDWQLNRYGRMVGSWSRWPQDDAVAPSLERGGLRIEGGTPADVQRNLRRILAGDDSEIRILCRDPQAPPAPPHPDDEGGPTRPVFVLVNSAGDLAEADLTKKTFAEFSYANDRETKVEAWAMQFAAALQWPELSVGGDGGYLKWTPRTYLAYQRRGGDDPAIEGYVNNLDLGGQVSGRLGFGAAGSWAGYYTLSGVYQTDDGLRSKTYAAELSVDPPLPYLPYHRGYRAIGLGDHVEADLKWRARLVADWLQVEDPGRKAALVDQAQYARLGYDAGVQLRAGPSAADWRLLLSLDYKLRDGQTGRGGDAQMFASSLNYLASDDTNWAFGISYERGENLQSFESIELWKLILGLRF